MPRGAAGSWAWVSWGQLWKGAPPHTGRTLGGRCRQVLMVVGRDAKGESSGCPWIRMLPRSSITLALCSSVHPGYHQQGCSTIFLFLFFSPDHEKKTKTSWKCSKPKVPGNACRPRAAPSHGPVVQGQDPHPAPGRSRVLSIPTSAGHARSRREICLWRQPWKGSEFPFVILSIKSSVFLQIQSYKLFILIWYILEGEFNTIHTFSFINLSVIRVLAHGRK